MTKKLWRCHVCNDIHLGNRAPEVCPTCGEEYAFVECSKTEALAVIGEYGREIDTAEELEEVWMSFTENSEFRLVDDEEFLETLAQGVLNNEENHGLKYCPCRMTTGDFKKDLKLVCPCNFKIQETYREKGECWCGLFIKR